MKLFWGILFLSLIACSKQKTFDEREIFLISPEKISGFDPINASDQYSGNEVGKVYEGLYEFHPLKRPYELMPNLADGMPSVSADGLTYTIKLKSGTKFQDSPAFPNGKGRELVADDVIFSWKRIADPKLTSKGWWIFDDKIVGLNEWRVKYSTAESTVYDELIEGLKKIDQYTVQIKLKKPYPQFIYTLAMPYTYIVAKEAVAQFGKEFLNYPVGTGPFVLPKFEQSNRIVYYRNPTFRDKFYPSEGEEGDDKLGFLADAGKKLPLVDKITVDIIIESQPKWLAFQKAKHDLLELKDSQFEQAVDQSKQLKDEFRKKGMRLIYHPMLDVTYFAFNHEDPIFKDVRVRRAMNLAFDRAEANKLFYEGTAVEAQGVIPPGLAGYRKDFKNIYTKFDLNEARKLLAEAGYPEGKGLPLITVQTRNETVSRQMIEHFAKSMAQIGIKVQTGVNTWPELINKVNTKQHQMYTMAWGADYPDAENFLGLLYCPNKAPGSNGANYCHEGFDTLFKTFTILQDSPERTVGYEKMNETSAFEVPWVFGFHRTKSFMLQAWLKNFKFTEFQHTQAQYLNVDLEVKKELSEKF